MKNIFSKTTKYLSYFSALLVLFGTVSCANDDVANEAEKPEIKGITKFTSTNIIHLDVNKDNETGIVRTIAESNGTKINFYWTYNDNLWVNTGTSSSPNFINIVEKEISNQIINGVEKNQVTFDFSNILTKDSYTVRYTGANSKTYDKVTIAANQAQVDPNNATHIGTSGDCGIATATKQANGEYNFDIAHKAAYMTFLPYSKKFAGAKITSIDVSADENIAGTYDFNDNGIVTSNPTSPSNIISLKLNNGDGFPIQSTINKNANGAIMVVCPGTYNNVTIKYNILTSTGNYVFISKNIGTVTFTTGSNISLNLNIQLPDYSDNYYMWDATEGQHYWKGYESKIPTANNKNYNNFPKKDTDQRFYNAVNFGTPASKSAKKCPNVNEMVWYTTYGDPHWDTKVFWAMGGVQHTGGVWIKKQSVIAAQQNKTIAQMKAKAPDGKDYRTFFNVNGSVPISTAKCSQGAPANVNDYFYLPALGSFNAGKLYKLETFGYYYSSTPAPNQYVGNYSAYQLCFTKDYINVSMFGREQGLQIWTAQ